MKFLSEAERIGLAGKIVMVRIDANIPLEHGVIKDPLKVDMSLPTIKNLLDQGAYVVVISHIGRPKGTYDEELSMKPIGVYVSEQLACPVPVISLQQLGGGYLKHFEKHSTKIIMLENIRFDPREEENSLTFAKELAEGADIYVNDAFSASHRLHASVTRLPEVMAPSFAGFHFEMEYTELTHALEYKEHPMCVILGGAKVDTKIGVLERLVHPADAFLLGGGVGNTFLAAQGYEVGESYCQQEYLEQARSIMLEIEKDHDAFVIPTDVIVSDSEDSTLHIDIKRESVTSQMRIYDIGKETVEIFERVIAKSKMIIWNGPMGLIEHTAYMEGTARVAAAIAKNKDAYTLIGGGDTVEVLQKIGLDMSHYSYVSTSGGAMLEYMEKGTLPGIEALRS